MWGASAVACAAACTADPVTADGECVSRTPEPGEVLVATLRCAAQLPEGAVDAVVGDTWLANAHLRAIVRGPERAWTLSGIGGGTILDAATWAGRDGLVEVAPLRDGAALQVIDAAQDAQGLTILTRRRALPGLPDVDPGPPVPVTWRAEPDGPWLAADGADGLYLHATPDATVINGWLVVGRTVYGHDGVAVTDLGGALIAHGASRLLVDGLTTAWGRTAAGPLAIDGTTDAAATVEAWRGDTRVAILPVDPEGRFAGDIPADADRVRAVADGRSASPWAVPGPSMSLPLDAPAAVALRLVWPDGVTPRPVAASWSDDDGVLRRVRLAPSGGALALGPGARDVVLGAGPWIRARTVRVELAAGDSAILPVSLDAGVRPPAGTHLLRIGEPDGRGPEARGLTAQRVRQRTAEGVGWLVLASHGIPALATRFVDDAAFHVLDAGVRLRHPDGGSLIAWPWAATTVNASAIGIPRLDPDSDLETTTVRAAGPLSAPRRMLVDLELLAHRRRPWNALSAPPDLVALPSPGRPPFAAWDPWWALIGEPDAPAPAGPFLWALADGPTNDPDPVALATALGTRALVATTGPWLGLTVQGQGPGGLTDPEDDRPWPPRIEVTVDAGDAPIDRLSLWVDGAVFDTIALGPDTALPWVPKPQPVDHVVAIAWSTTDADAWAVTAPVRLGGRPGTIPPDTATPETP